MGSAAEHGAVCSRSRRGAALAGEWLVAPEGRLFPRQHHRAAHMGCSLQPAVNRTAATAIVPSLPLVISPLRRWGDHFQAYGAIPGTVERRQILHDKLPPGAGQHSLPALHRYHTHCFAKGVPAPAFPHPCSQQFPAMCLRSLVTAGRLGSALCHLVVVPCGGRGSPSQPVHPSKGGGECLSHNILILQHRAHSSQPRPREQQSCQKGNSPFSSPHPSSQATS